MAGKEARTGWLYARKWRVRVSMLLGGAAVVMACVAVRQFWGAESADAKSPFQWISSKKDKDDSSEDQRPASTATAKTATRSTAGSGKLKVMAVVEGQQITRHQLARECLRRHGEDVLESMVNKYLILDACKKRGIVVTEKDVADEISRMASKFGLSTDRWLTLLEKERNITPKQYSRDIIWPTLALRRLATDQIQVTPAEIDQALEAEFGPQVRVRLISAATSQKAEQLRAIALSNPAEFGKLAKDHSEDTASASAYGWIPPIRRHIGDPQVEQVAFGLREGEIGPVIHAANQYLFMKCEKHEPAARISPEQREAAKQEVVEHIRDGKLREAAAKLFQQLQAESKVVNIYNHPDLRQQMPGVAATINGSSITVQQLSEECLSRHGRDVLEGEINRLVLMKELHSRKLAVSETDIDAEIARAADAYGYVHSNGTPDVEKWLKTVTEHDGATVDLYVRDAVWPSVALKKLVAGEIEVTKDDMQKGFEANYGERVEALAIVLGNQRQAQKVWDMARNNPTDEFFGELAYQYSVDPVSKANYGKVPPLQRHGGRPLLEKAAFELQPGEISGVLAVGDKSVILRCLGRTKPIVTEFEAVKGELYKDIHEKKLRLRMGQEFDRLKESAQIDNFLAGTSQPGKKATAPGGRPASAARSAGPQRR